MAGSKTTPKDYVEDPVFGLVPKDVETANRLNLEAREARAKGKGKDVTIPPTPPTA